MYVVLGMYDCGFKSLKYYQIQYLSSFLYREAHPSRHPPPLNLHIGCAEFIHNLGKTLHSPLELDDLSIILCFFFYK